MCFVNWMTALDSINTTDKLRNICINGSMCFTFKTMEYVPHEWMGKILTGFLLTWVSSRVVFYYQLFLDPLLMT